jgi:DeoR family glycerol-3-phosphate regulon repressor
LSVAAIDAQSGFMLQDMDEAAFSRAAGSQAETRMIVADNDKFGRTAPIIVDQKSRFDHLVTNAEPPEDIAAMLAENQIRLTIAGRGGAHDS